MSKGFLLTFEGGEKTGKSTIVKMLSLFLFSEFGIIPTVVREPGSTLIGEKIRDILHDRQNSNMHPKTEALLYQASRAQLVTEVVEPDLEEGSLVIIDRFKDSSKVYQGAGRGLGMDKIEELNDFSTNGLKPDLTILLDVDLETAQERSKNDGIEVNRMDLQGTAFDETVRKTYLELAKSDERWRIVSTKDKTIDEVFSEVKGIVVEKLYQVGYLERENQGKER